MQVKRGLFELRAKSKEVISRAFYCFQVGQCIVILHGFIKKTKTTPDDELVLARKRLKEVQQHGSKTTVDQSRRLG